MEIRLFLPYLRSGDRASPSVGQDRLILTCLSQTTEVGQLHRLAALEEKLDKCFYVWYNLISQEIGIRGGIIFQFSLQFRQFCYIIIKVWTICVTNQLRQRVKDLGEEATFGFINWRIKRR